MSKIRVLYITSLLSKMGGAERNIYDTVINIDTEKFTPYVCCLTGGDLAEKIRSKGVYLKIFGLKKIFGFEGIRKGIELFRLLRRENIDIVVTYHHDADIWGGITAKLALVPVVISSRRDIGYQLTWKHIWMYRILNRFYTKIISVSDAVKREIIRREWVHAGKIETVYNGVDSKNYGPEAGTEEKLALRRSLGIGPTELIVGSLGALRPIKGQIFLIRAAAEIIKKHKDIKFLMIGYKETAYYIEIKKTVDDLGLGEYFIFTGDVVNIRQMLSIFDIFVLSSISEGFSNAVIEAMTAGKPVIASNSGGNPEAVIDNKTGIQAPPRDVRALSEAIKKLIDNPELRESMGHEGRIRALSLFTLENMLNRIEEMYEYLLTAARKPERGYFLIKALNKENAKKFVKIISSYLLYYVGIPLFYKKNSSRKIKALAYHSINKVSLKPLEIEQDPENFEMQMLCLKEHFRILSLSEFLQYRNKGKKFTDNSVLLTFDDGYFDNYTNAFPVLKKYNIPAVIFLTTDPVESNEPLFFDTLRYAIRETRKLILDLRDVGLSQYFLDQGDQCLMSGIIKEITGFSKLMENHAKTRLINTILSRLEVDLQTMKNRKIYLAWNDISNMAKHGIEFGSHTKTHPQLSFLSFADCKKELTESKKTIEDNTGIKVRALAYPFGSISELNGSVEKAAIEAGYECAFSLCDNKKIKGLSDFTISRKIVDSHMSSQFSGRFCKPLFLADLFNVWQLK